MAAANSMDVTLVPVDTSILSCWEEKVKQGIECSLLLQHSKGKVITTLKCSVDLQPPKAGSVRHLAPSTQAEEKGRTKKKKNNKGGKKRKLESLLAYHQRLVEERVLPPSRLMLEQAAQTQLPLQEKGSQKPETLRHSELNQSLNTSYANEEREEISSVNADAEEPDVEEELEAFWKRQTNATFVSTRLQFPGFNQARATISLGWISGTMFGVNTQKKANGLLDCPLFLLTQKPGCNQSLWKYPLCLGLCGVLSIGFAGL